MLFVCFLIALKIFFFLRSWYVGYVLDFWRCEYGVRNDPVFLEKLGLEERDKQHNKQMKIDEIDINEGDR